MLEVITGHPFFVPSITQCFQGHIKVNLVTVLETIGDRFGEGACVEGGLI